jgi:hypothetical protein
MLLGNGAWPKGLTHAAPRRAMASWPLRRLGLLAGIQTKDSMSCIAWILVVAAGFLLTTVDMRCGPGTGWSKGSLALINRHIHQSKP